MPERAGEESGMDDRTAVRPKRRWLRRTLAGGGVALLLLGGSFFGFGGPDVLRAMGKPSAPFDPAKAPPAPDYAHPDAWLAFPGRNGIERSTPPGIAAIDEAKAPVDVFFIHPTTYEKNDVWNVPYEATPSVAKLDGAVLEQQVGVFNGCCRLFAPHYRQTSVTGLSNQGAVAIAYSDVERAFRYFIAHESKGRPFIIASHSQGTFHAVELLQREILGTPLQARLVAAYLVGGYTPVDFPTIGLPICDAPKQTDCVLSYNTSKAGARLARMVIQNKTYWWKDGERDHDQAPAICVNPLDWRQNGSAPASMNAGSLPFPEPPFPDQAHILPALVPNLTGATCHDQMLEVSLPWGAPKGFSDTLSRLFGSYHLNDYGLFYASLHQNAIDRVAAWQAAHPAK